MGTRACGDQHLLTSEKLLETAHGDITQDQAEEMLWAVDWRRDGEGGGKNLPFIDVIAAVLMNVNLKPGKLPPELKSSEVQDWNGQSSIQLLSSNTEDFSLDPDMEEKKFTLLKGRSSSATGDSLEEMFPDMNIMSNPIFKQVEGLVRDMRDSAVEDQRSQRETVETYKTGVLENVLAKAKSMPLRPTPSTKDCNDKNKHCHETLAKEAAGCRPAVYRLFEVPSSSPAAQYLAAFMGVMIVLSVFSLFLEPLITPPDKDPTDSEKLAWRIVETIFNTTFTIEFVARMSVHTSVGHNTLVGFLKNPSNICDLVALLPFYVELILLASADGLRLLRTARLIKLIRLLRVSRVMRLNRLSKLLKHRSGVGALVGPVSMVFTVVWGIYLLSL
jgi:hypothetical protein